MHIIAEGTHVGDALASVRYCTRWTNLICQMHANGCMWLRMGIGLAGTFSGTIRSVVP